ncbi:sensor histidine kinase [Pedobacter gandavensis]|uniref:histidine kinase n=1 Tax=Pedobacter gandavensis TaxID=2679963 RepID=A0ABR6F1C8_9SPHI|nr:7TM diverse intracellular signaling domain-containing protein [Pedobacter gandavensis]MBB2151324.1 GHKL domain-containing protein [Pedobacter gandavensis]
MQYLNSLKKMHQFFCLIMLFLLMSSETEAQVIQLNSTENTQINISDQVSTFEDPSAKLSLEEVIKKAEFRPNYNKIANFGLTKSQIWIRIKIADPKMASDYYLQLKSPNLDKVVFYYPEKGQYKTVKSGNEVSILLRDIVHQDPIFRLRTTSDTTTYYLKVAASSPITLPLFIGSYSVIMQGLAMESNVFSLYMGLIITMFLYNIFIYSTVRDRSYLFYVVYIFSVGFTQLCLQGYAFSLLWGDNPYLNNQGLVFSIVFVGITSILFTKEFLHVKNFYKNVNTYMNVLIVLYLICFGISLSGYPVAAQMALQLLTIVASISVIVTGIIIYRKKYRPALYFTISWSCFLIGVIIFILKDVGILSYTFLTNNAILIGSGLEAVLLSFALADKINIFKKEKEESQSEALRILTENEKLVREQNVLLEIKVKERTEALENINTSLNDALSNLKETQSQLVDSEKMASLGQLTAGIAHEINNPINFVTSNIKPLQMDIDDLNELIDMYEKIDPAQDLNSQLSTIENFKRSIDLDFVREEIKSLLSGIGEGAKRTAEIIRSLKNFSRLDENDTKPVDLNEGLDSTLVLLRSTFPGNLQIVKNYGTLPKVECMPGKINQVFMNLISNAIQAIKGKESPAAEELLSINTWQEGEEVKISIKDSGSGMSEEVKQKIFEPFFTTKDVGEGTGLGLSIVFRIIENHQGHIDVVTKVNQGTEFIITLPLISR